MLPCSGEDVAKVHSGMITAFEKKEVLKYPVVYYLGTSEAKE
jgi:hypothetical protein